MTKAADFLLSREVCLVQPSKEVLYVLLYAHLDHLHSILECEFRWPTVGQTAGAAILYPLHYSDRTSFDRRLSYRRGTIKHVA